MRSGIASVFNVHEPRIRLKGITNNSKMRINFNNNMVLPSDFKEIVANNRRNLQANEQPMIQIESLAGDDSDLDNLNLDWEISGADESGLDFKLKYKDPLEVSQNDIPDKVKLRLNLNSFTDEYGQSLGNDTTLIVEVPRQIPSEEEADALEKGGETSEATSSSVMGGNFIVNLILAASLNHLWSMLNGL